MARSKRGASGVVPPRGPVPVEPSTDVLEAVKGLVPGPETQTTPTPSRPRHNLIRRLQLVVVSGPDNGKRAVSNGDLMVIGKHESCDLVLNDDTVSRFHCELTIEGGRVTVRDLESRNGTVVDGVAITIAHPRNGSSLSLGTTQIRLDFGTDHVSVPASEKESFGSLVGRSMAMRTAFALLERASATETTILLEGETGTGKEGAAEAIHDASTRRSAPLIVVDCGAIPPNLLESELFGHERGAFTGAVTARKGAFEAANGGTIFLDEIGELVGDLQPKLLRAIEKREVKRVGADHYVSVDVRIIAATNRNLRTEVNAGKFRSDLFFRLAVLIIRLPPLRERKEDMGMIVEAILDRLGAANAPEAETLRTADFLDYVTGHSWPGNVRELRNYLERCLTLQARAGLTDDGPGEGPAPPLVDPKAPLKQARERWNDECERQYVEALLAAHANNASSAARAAEIDRPYLYRLLWKHGLR